jgi:CRP-like cAMP-binding protein
MAMRTASSDGEVIFSQGDTADAVFYIQSGTVKLTVWPPRVARKL